MPYRPSSITTSTSTSASSSSNTGTRTSSDTNTSSNTSRTWRYGKSSSIPAMGTSSHDDSNSSSSSSSSHSYGPQQKPQPQPESSPMTLPTTPQSFRGAPSDEDDDRRYHRHHATTTTATTTTTTTKNRWQPHSTIQMVVKKPTTNHSRSNPWQPPAAVGLQVHPTRQPHRPTTNRLQAHLSKMAQRTTSTTGTGPSTSQTSTSDPTRPTAITSASNNTFISPMTTDLTETEDDYQFQTIPIRQRHDPTRSFSSSSSSSPHTAAAAAEEEEDCPTKQPPEEPPGRNNDDAMWYPQEPNHTVDDDNTSSNEPPAAPLVASMSSPPRFRPTLDVYSPTTPRDDTSDEHYEEDDPPPPHHPRQFDGTTTIGRSKSWDDIQGWRNQPSTRQPLPQPPSPPPHRTMISVEEEHAMAALSPTAQKYLFYDNKPRRHHHDYHDLDIDLDATRGVHPNLSHVQPPATPPQTNDSDGNDTTTIMDYQWTTLPAPPLQQQQRPYASSTFHPHVYPPMQRVWSNAVVETIETTRAMTNAAMTMRMRMMETTTTSTGDAMRKSQSFDQDATPSRTTTEMGQLQQPQQPQLLLSWRMDPKESLSDWKIQAFDRSTKQFTTYHVHKVVLCVGSRACGYFARQQQQQQQQQQVKEPYHHATTTVQLPLIRKACELLPQLLDFCYSTPHWEVTRETAVGLVFLATLLDQPQLKSMAMEFVYNDLSPVSGKEEEDTTTVLVGSVLHHYMADAVYFDQDELVEFLLELCATHLLEMNAPSRILDELSPPQFLAVLRQIPKRSSARLSTLVVDYCVSHRLELTLPFVETCACLCPILATDTALALLELYLTLGGGGGTEDNYCYHHHNGVDGDSTANSGIGLLHRCLKVLAEDPAALLVNSDTFPSLVNQILDVCPPLLGPWMRDMLHHALKQGTQVQADLREAWEQQALTRDELIDAKRALEQAHADRQQLQKTLESTKLELRQQLDGWMGKSHRDCTEHSTRQAIWQEERDLWRLERHAWMEERGALEHELYRLKAQLNRQREVSEMNKHKRRHSSKSKEDFGNPCPQVQAQGILNYLSNVGMPGPAEEVSMQVSDDDSFSSELNTIDRSS